MPDLAKIVAIETRLNAGSEPAPEGSAAPPDGSSGAGSAPADASGVDPAREGGGQSPAGATIDHAVLERKLAADRARREDRTRQKQIAEDKAAAKKAREEAEAEKAKWSGVGKEKTWLETIRALGKDPLQAFEEMRAEAMKAGTPDAKLEAMDRAWQARHEALTKELKEERDARAAEKQTTQQERERAQQEAGERSFISDFRKATEDPAFESLTEEYEPEQLYPFVTTMRDNPDKLFSTAKKLGVGLTFQDGRFNMTDILSVLKAQQSAHYARIEEQRRKKGAAPQPSPAGDRKPAEGKRPTVNGTAERNAGTSLGNTVASTRAADAPSHKGESREQRVQRVAAKYG